MAQIPGTVFCSHAGWRVARPDSAYERMVLPPHCEGDLIVESYVGDRVHLACNKCTFEVTTDTPRDSQPDLHHESGAREEIPF